MKVKELIKILEGMDTDMDVYLYVSNGDDAIANIEAEKVEISEDVVFIMSDERNMWRKK